jgi:hypothetical protein
MTVEFLYEIFRIKDKQILNSTFFTLIDCSNNSHSKTQLNILQLGDIVSEEIRNISHLIKKPDDSSISKIISDTGIISGKSNGNGTVKLSYKNTQFDVKIFKNNNNIRVCPDCDERDIMEEELGYIPMNRIALEGFTKGKWLIGLQYDVEISQDKNDIFKVIGPTGAYNECKKILTKTPSNSRSYDRICRLITFAGQPFGRDGLKYSPNLSHDLFIYRENPTRYAQYSTDHFSDFEIKIPLIKSPHSSFEQQEQKKTEIDIDKNELKLIIDFESLERNAFYTTKYLGRDIVIHKTPDGKIKIFGMNE